VGSADAELRILRKEHPDPEAEIAFESLALVAGDDVSVERLMLEEVLPTGLFASGAELIGATNDPLTSPGISFPVDVYWRISPGDGRSSPVTLELRDEGGTVVDRQADDFQAPLLADLESPGGVYAARYWLSMPRRAEPGLYGIYLGAGDQPALVEASSIEVEEPVRIWRAPDMAHPTGDELADGRISLAGYDLVVADGAIDLTLYWKSLEAVDGNWKVFVHLLGPDGAIAAQSDSFPGGGLRWTDTWKPREYVIDPHTMNPPDPLDGGGYTVLVGMYDPETGVRVPVATDPDGRLSDAIHLTVTAP
jgi:hypothetical protein